MEDKTIECQDCKKEFIWTVEEQKFFEEHKINKEPIRCRSCAILLREKKKKQDSNN